MLKINFLNEKASIEQIKALADCVNFESCDMMISVNNKTIANKTKIVVNKNNKYDDDEVATAQATIDKLKEANKKLKEKKAELRAVYDQVIAEMTTANEKGYANTVDQVRTVLRLVACAENQKFYEHATIPSLKDAQLYYAMEDIHVNNIVCDDGYSVNSKERVELYKKANDRLDAIVRDMYSLPVATPYTTALRVKLNKEDRKSIHDVYVNGLSNKFKTDKSGNTTLVSSGVTTAIKDTKKDVDYSKFAKNIAMIVIRKYAK